MHELEQEVLFKIAASDRIRLDPNEQILLRSLLFQGYLQKLEAPRQVTLEAQYETLQGRHGHYQEAKTLLDGIQKRLAPKSRLGGLLASSPPPALPKDDEELLRLQALLEGLGIQLRNLEIPEQLEKLKEHLAVDSRQCLDRLGAIDRELEAERKSAAAGTLVEQEGYFTLTRSGAEILPEHLVMEDLEVFFQAVSGPRKQKIEDFAHFRDDPASFLAFFMECMRQHKKPSEVILDFEALSEAYERVAAFSEIRSFRLKNAFMMRLMRNFREEPKQRYLWCNRERIQALLALTRPLLPGSVVDSGWQLLHATDLLLARSGGGDPLEQEAMRIQAFRTIQKSLKEGRPGMGDAACMRLSLAMLHAALAQNFAGSALLDRFVKQMTDASMEGGRLAPRDLSDPDSRLIFGFHLAHGAGFILGRIGPLAEKAAAIDAALLREDPRHRPPLQVVLHTLLCLERLERVGVAVGPREYAGIFTRIQNRLLLHKGIARALRTESATDEDRIFLAANLAAKCCFARLPAGLEAKILRDAGTAGAYEPRDPSSPPLLGLPFGTLMLA